MNTKLGMYYVNEFKKTKDMQFLVAAYGVYVQMENITPGSLNSICGRPDMYIPEYYTFIEGVEDIIEEWNPGAVFKLKDFTFIYNFFKDVAEVSKRSDDMWSVFDNVLYDELVNILMSNKLCHLLNYLMLCIEHDTYKTCYSNYAWGRFTFRTIADTYYEEGDSEPDNFDRHGLIRNIKQYYKVETKDGTIRTILNRMLSKFLEASSKNHPELYKKLLELHMIETIYAEKDRVNGEKYKTTSFKKVLMDLDIIDKNGNVKIIVPEDVFDTLKVYMENDKPNIIQLIEVKEKYKLIETEFPNVLSDWLYVDAYGDNALVYAHLPNISWTSTKDMEKVKALKETLDKILEACNCYNDILNNRGGK